MTGNLFERAERVIPGGVSSPARAFGAVGGAPMFAARGDGAWLFDTDDNRYIDYIQGYGAIILGHARVESMTDVVSRGAAFGLSTEAEVRLAELVVERVPSIDRVRFLASGTEAAMTAARIARAATGRSLLVKFEGCYHGHADAFLAKAGSGVATFGVAPAGVPDGAVHDTAVLPYNDTAALAEVFAVRGEEVAGVFVEPIAANMGVVRPDAAFLSAIADECSRHAAIVVFDEVVTGFRVGDSGAQGLYGLRPDLTLLGKVLGGGMPIGAVGGRADLMELLAPSGPVYQAGTFAAHPHAMAAGVAALERLGPGDYAELEAKTVELAQGLVQGAKDADVEATVARAGTFLSLFFASEEPRRFSDVEATDRSRFGRFHRELRNRGVLIPPSPFEAWFPSLAHGAAEIEQTIDAAAQALESVRR